MSDLYEKVVGIFVVSKHEHFWYVGMLQKPFEHISVPSLLCATIAFQYVVGDGFR